MPQISWQSTTQVLDAIGFFDVRRQTQAPKIRGLRQPGVNWHSLRVRQTQAPKIRGLRPFSSFVNSMLSGQTQAPKIRGLRRFELFHFRVVRQTQAPKIRGLRLDPCPIGVHCRPNPSPENQGIKTEVRRHQRQPCCQTQAPKIRGLRHVTDVEVGAYLSQTQAPKIRGLRPAPGALVNGLALAKPKPRKSGD